MIECLQSLRWYSRTCDDIFRIKELVFDFLFINKCSYLYWPRFVLIDFLKRGFDLVKYPFSYLNLVLSINVSLSEIRFLVLNISENLFPHVVVALDGSLAHCKLVGELSCVVQVKLLLDLFCYLRHATKVV